MAKLLPARLGFAFRELGINGFWVPLTSVRVAVLAVMLHASQSDVNVARSPFGLEIAGQILFASCKLLLWLVAVLAPYFSLNMGG